MEIRLYLQMLKKGWWIVLITILVAVNATLIYSFLVTPVYQANAKFLVSPNMSVIATGDQTLNSLDTLDKQSVVGTYAEFLNSDKVYLETLQDLKLNEQDMADYKRTTVILTDTRILDLTVQGPDPKLCAILANGIGEKGIQYIRKFYQVYDINTMDPAAIPTQPISPKPVRDSLLALVFGIVLGSALAILSEQIRVPIESLKTRNVIDNESLVYNRHHLDRLVEVEMMRSKSRGDVFSLGLVRLDGLVEIIDHLPTLLAQRILQNVTRILKKELKGTDIIGRWDKTTFAIILPSTPYIAANNLMGRICQKLAEPMDAGEGNGTIQLNPYVGVARSRDDEMVAEFIFRTQKDLDGRMFNVSAAPLPVARPVTADKPTPAAPQPLSVAQLDEDILDTLEAPSNDIDQAIDRELNKTRKEWQNPNKG
jgi:diguanylate cyclase (GGDEF)-like protein